MPPTPNSVCTPGGGWNARDAGFEHCDPNRVGQFGLLTNRASAMAYRGVAAMKYADWDRLVVPVLAMTVWPLSRPRPAAVPLPVVSADSAQSTSAAWSAVSTWRVVIFAGVTELPTMIFLITCGLWYRPLSASVAIVVACSSTVSDAWPSAIPASSCMGLGPPTIPLARTSTPKALAMSVTGCRPVVWSYATRCHRSV